MARMIGFSRILVDFDVTPLESYRTDLDSYVLSTMRYARERSLGCEYIYFHKGREVRRLDRDGTVFEFHPWNGLRSLAWRFACERRDIALFHIHSEGRDSVLLGMLLHLLGVRVCQFLHNDRRIAALGAPDWLLRINLERVVRVLWVYTRYQQRRILEDEGYRAPVEVWPAAVALPPEVAARWDPETGPLQLLYVGRISPQKDLTDLARGLAMLPDPRRVRLTLVGQLADQDKPYGASVEAILREAGVPYTRTGFVDPSGLGQYYRDAHVFLNMRRNEGFGKVFIEAAAHGLPLVGRRGSAGPEELIRDGHNGFLVEGPEGLASRLQEWLGSPERIRAMGGAARRDVAEHRTLENAYRKLESVYDGIIGRD